MDDSIKVNWGTVSGEIKILPTLLLMSLAAIAGLPAGAFQLALGPGGAIRSLPPDDNPRANYYRFSEVLLEVVAHSLPRTLPHAQIHTSGFYSTRGRT